MVPSPILAVDTRRTRKRRNGGVMRSRFIGVGEEWEDFLRRAWHPLLPHQLVREIPEQRGERRGKEARGARDDDFHRGPRARA